MSPSSDSASPRVSLTTLASLASAAVAPVASALASVQKSVDGPDDPESTAATGSPDIQNASAPSSGAGAASGAGSGAKTGSTADSGSGSGPGSGPAPEDSSANTLPGGPVPWQAAVADSLGSLPAQCDKSAATEALLEGCIFDLRRRLSDRLAREYAPPLLEADVPDLQWEDVLRASLPPLYLPTGPYAPLFSAWRSSIVAVLGLLAGSALGQGLLLYALPGAGGGLAVICGVLGVAVSLWLHHTLLMVAARGRLTLSWIDMKWKDIRRWFRWGLLALTVAALLRDFMAARDVVAHILGAVGLFLTQGRVLEMFSSIYGSVAWLALFSLCLMRPLRLDREAFDDRVTLAARNWWAGAARAAEALAVSAHQNRADKAKQWRQAGMDIYSFAAELPPTRREWLEDRLRLLGLEAPRDTGGPLVWEPALRDRYETLGHVEPGELCYVDQPPLLEQGQLLRKGVLRKVRR